MIWRILHMEVTGVHTSCHRLSESEGLVVGEEELHIIWNLSLIVIDLIILAYDSV
jgi:hypothetical protein